MRQASAEMEITAEMVEAGADVLSNFESRDLIEADRRDLVRWVLQAALEEVPRSHCAGR